MVCLALIQRFFYVVDTVFFRRRLHELQEFLLRKKYPLGVIQCGINRALQLDRRTILDADAHSQSQVEKAQTIPFVYTNNCANPDVMNIVQKSLDILTPSQRMTTVMQNKKVVAARRHPRNLRSLLFRPRYETQSKITRGGVKPCRNDTSRGKLRGRPCKCCDFLNECTHFLFKGAKESFELRHDFTCDTRNVLYVITCQGCGDNYIGKTEREVRERCGEYRNAVANKKFTQRVHEHLALCGQGRFTMTPFLKIHDSQRDSQTILSYESLFNKRYKPKFNVLKL